MDLSEKGYGVSGEPGLPAIRHLATFNKDTFRKAAFYMQEINENPEPGHEPPPRKRVGGLWRPQRIKLQSTRRDGGSDPPG